MNPAAGPDRGDERWLTFTVGETAYALPIRDVFEVVEPGEVCGVPTLSRERGGVVNWHGDALPVFASRLLLEPSAGEEAAAASAVPQSRTSLAVTQLLVICNATGESACFGLPVDRVTGLVDGPLLAPARSSAGSVVDERRPIDGHEVGMVDPERLIARAEEIVGELAV